MTIRFPELGDWRATRRALHAYSRVLSAIRGALSEPDPRWWHISLQVGKTGLTTGPLAPVESHGGVELKLDLVRHRAILQVAGGGEVSLSLLESPTATRLGAWALDRLSAGHGLVARTDRSRWEDPAPRSYDPAAAERYRQAVWGTARALERLRTRLPGERGPVQLWAHHFDVAFEIFGTRTPEHEGRQQPAQIGFGFSPGDDNDPAPYFYATPWPFDSTLVGSYLPESARWLIEPWQGALLPYSAVVGGDSDRLRDFWVAAFEASRTILG